LQEFFSPFMLRALPITSSLTSSLHIPY
jgi:hypothetical protein